jgi:hypothetical protein
MFKRRNLRPNPETVQKKIIVSATTVKLQKKGMARALFRASPSTVQRLHASPILTEQDTTSQAWSLTWTVFATMDNEDRLGSSN